jgi:phage tail-like protein
MVVVSDHSSASVHDRWAASQEVGSVMMCDMATLRDHPYESSNFLVDLGDGDTSSPRALFMRVDLPDAIIDEVIYREGGDRTQEPRKQPGLVKYGHLVLKRGLIGSLDLWEWWKQAREGLQVDRNVVVTLLDEARNAAWTWRFHNAFPVNYRINPLDANCSDLAVEELTLTFDSMDIE